MAAEDHLDSITSRVDVNSLGWTLAPPATRRTARYGIRRPSKNTYSSLIYSQAPVLPTDPTRITPRKNCRRGSCSQSNDVLESKELLCGDCIQPIRGPGQPAWVDAYRTRDEMQKLLIDSDARDALIRKAYEDAANQSYQTESKPVLCKALARLFQHDAHRPMKPNPKWSDEDYRVAQWYCKNCYPYVSPAGSVMWYERPLVPKSWIDNVVRTLGPIYNYMDSSCACIGGGCADPQACPCPPASRERGVYPRPPPSSPAAAADATARTCARKPTQNQQARAQRTAARDFYASAQASDQAAVLQHYTGNESSRQRRPVVASHVNRYNCAPKKQNSDNNNEMNKFYSLLPNNAQGDAVRREQARIVAVERARLDAANPDYGERIYQAQVADHRVKSAQNQLRMSRFLDSTVTGHTPGAF